MMKRTCPSTAAILGVQCLVTPIAWAATAGAQDTPATAKLECIGAAEQAQRMLAKGQLLEARRDLRVCVRDVCPSVVRSDCEHWLATVDRDIPSLVISVQDDSGKTPADAELTIDGMDTPVWGGARAIELDPGEHLLAITRAGGLVMREGIVVEAGSKGRQVLLRLPPSQKSFPSRPASAPEPRPTHAANTNALAWASVGLAAVALGSFAYFGATGTSELHSLRNSCGSRCDPSDVNSAWNKLIVGDVSLGVTLVASGLAAWLFLTSREPDPKQNTAYLNVNIAVSKNTAALDWKIGF